MIAFIYVEGNTERFLFIEKIQIQVLATYILLPLSHMTVFSLPFCSRLC